MSAFDHAVSSSASAREANETRDRSIARVVDVVDGAREAEARARRRAVAANITSRRVRLRVDDWGAPHRRARVSRVRARALRGTDDDDDARDDRDGAERDDEDDEGDERMIPIARVGNFTEHSTRSSSRRARAVVSQRRGNAATIALEALERAIPRVPRWAATNGDDMDAIGPAPSSIYNRTTTRVDEGVVEGVVAGRRGRCLENDGGGDDDGGEGRGRLRVDAIDAGDGGRGGRTHALELSLRSILSHETLEQSLSFVLANKLADSTLLPTQLMEIFNTVLLDDETEAGRSIREAVRRGRGGVQGARSGVRRYAHALLNFKGFHALEAHRIQHALWDRDKNSWRWRCRVASRRCFLWTFTRRRGSGKRFSSITARVSSSVRRA